MTEKNPFLELAHSLWVVVKKESLENKEARDRIHEEGMYIELPSTKNPQIYKYDLRNIIGYHVKHNGRDKMAGSINAALIYGGENAEEEEEISTHNIIRIVIPKDITDKLGLEISQETDKAVSPRVLFYFMPQEAFFPTIANHIKPRVSLEKDIYRNRNKRTVLQEDK